MKKQIITRRAASLFFLFTGFNLSGICQGTGGFFNQQSSKVKLMLAQIAGYQSYYVGLKNGYHIASNGLNKLHQIKGGTYDLNQTYYTSLQQVNPVVKNNSKAKAAADMLTQINGLFNAEIAWQQKQQILSGGEMGYIRAVYQNLQKKCKADMSELTDVLTPGKLQMNDNQRLDRISHVYIAMQDKLAFAASFTSHCRQLANDRKKAKVDNQQIKKLYGID